MCCVELALKGVLCIRLDSEGPLNMLSEHGFDSTGLRQLCHAGVSVCMSLAVGLASYLIKAHLCNC